VPLVTLNTVLDKARQANCAVPAIDVLDHASALAVVAAAEQVNRPVILLVPESGFPIIEVPTFFAFLVDLAKSATVPVVVMLDHGKTLEAVMLAIHAGASAVMIDASDLPHTENIALTRKVVELAHAAGVSVEGEIGHVGGGEGSFDGTAVDESRYTTARDAVDFINATGVDALAVAVGTVHGVYQGTPQLDLDRLAAIRSAVDAPLVLHGGSGLTDSDFQAAIKAGITKVNLFTELSMTALAQAVAYAASKDNKLHFAELIAAGQQSVKERTIHYLKLFGNEPCQNT